MRRFRDGLCCSRLSSHCLRKFEDVAFSRLEAAAGSQAFEIPAVKWPPSQLSCMIS